MVVFVEEQENLGTRRPPVIATRKSLHGVYYLPTMTAMNDVNQTLSHIEKQFPAQFGSTWGRCHKATSMSLAASLIGRMTSVSEKAMRAEVQVKLQDTINSMDPIDREILVLRHFEELSNNEAAAALGIKKAAASNRYIRALKRLKDTLSSVPGMLGN